MAQTKVKEGLIDATLGGGITWDSTAKTANFAATAGSGYLVDTSSSAITVTLPSSPSVGDEVTLVDYGANAATNNITITSSDDIEDSTNDVKIDYNKGSVVLFYSGATKGWLVKSAANETATALIDNPPTFSVDYLIVAGGGGGGGGNLPNGGNGGGGGGAGGLRSTVDSSGGGASAETSLNIAPSTDYIVTVGPGGSGGAYGSSGTNGTDSVFSTITSVGGGYGGSNADGASGGSGGGGGGDILGTTFVGGTATSSPVQGYDGGDGDNTTSSPYNYWGGGGGGASQAGNDGNNYSTIPNGGDGLAVSITGSSLTYAGGGGGGNWSDSNNTTQSSGGAGGGGNGSVRTTNSSGFNGTDNLGGGGGGGGAGGSGGNGGSGVVILRYPNTYTISETTSGGNVLSFTTATVGSDKVTTFTAGDGTIEFST